MGRGGRRALLTDVAPVVLTVVPGRYRPGVGRLPRTDGRRPMLPVHARHCPPLEAGCALGYLVYPALQDHESFQIRRSATGELLFSFFGGDPAAPAHLFTTRYAIPAGSLGVWSEEVVYAADGGACGWPVDHSDPRCDHAHGQPVGPARSRRASRGIRLPHTPGMGSRVHRGPQPARAARVRVDREGGDRLVRLRDGVPLRDGGGRRAEWFGCRAHRPGVRRSPRRGRSRAATPDTVAEFRASQDAFLAEKADQRHATALGFEFDSLYRSRSQHPRG